MKHEEFLIHLGPNMSNDDRTHLQATMLELSGVASAHYNDESKLKLIITYDPEKTNPKLISERVTAWNLNGS